MPKEIAAIAKIIPTACFVVKLSFKKTIPTNAEQTGINTVNSPAILAGTSAIPLNQRKNENILAVKE